MWTKPALSGPFGDGMYPEARRGMMALFES